MKLDRTQQVTGALAIVFFAYFVSQTVHLNNEAKKNPAEPTTESRPTPPPHAPGPDPILVTEPPPPNKGKIGIQIVGGGYNKVTGASVSGISGVDIGIQQYNSVGNEIINPTISSSPVTEPLISPKINPQNGLPAVYMSPAWLDFIRENAGRKTKIEKFIKKDRRILDSQMTTFTPQQKEVYINLLGQLERQILKVSNNKDATLAFIKKITG